MEANGRCSPDIGLRERRLAIRISERCGWLVLQQRSAAAAALRDLDSLRALRRRLQAQAQSASATTGTNTGTNTGTGTSTSINASTSPRGSTSLSGLSGMSGMRPSVVLSLSMAQSSGLDAAFELWSQLELVGDQVCRVRKYSLAKTEASATLYLTLAILH